MHYTSTKLQDIINTVNNRYFKGLNDDDARAKMEKIDKSTKGFSFMPRWDDYILVSDFEKLKKYSEKYGYWSEEVKNFNETLKEKGGYSYMEELNNQLKN